MRVAIIHYWLVAMRGGEKVLAELCELYPEADIYTHVYRPGAVDAAVSRHRIFTTFINSLPYSGRLYKYYLPLMPMALGLLRLDDYDLIISSESGPAKGIKTPDGALHVCYCHTPMRYIWDMYDEYKDSARWIVRTMMRMLVPWLRRWDCRTAGSVDCFVANSHFVKERIKRIYRRDAAVIAPPVSIEDFTTSDQSEDYFLYVGELTHYKRPQLAVEAFTRTGRRLVVVGSGELLDSLRSLAGPGVSFVGKVSGPDLREWYARCRALIFPGSEDFGIVPVEAMASGRPVIAYAGGGALETVVDGETGLFFHEQNADALNAAIDRFESSESAFSASAIRSHAEQFSASRFRREWMDFMENRCSHKAG